MVDIENTDTKTYICEDCGKEVGYGDWPFCPHGKGQGGFKVKDGTPRPSWITHRKPKITDERLEEIKKM